LKGPLKNPKNISDIPHQKIHRKDLFVKVWFLHFRPTPKVLRVSKRYQTAFFLSFSDVYDFTSRTNIKTIKGEWS